MKNSGIEYWLVRRGLALILAMVLAGGILRGGSYAVAAEGQLTGREGTTEQANAATVYEPGASENGLILKKTAAYDPSTNSARIQLEAYVTGTVTTETVGKDIPCDIVLVLDFSNSMTGKFINEDQTRGEALQAAVNNFIDAVSGKYAEGKTEHRICLIYYNGEDAGEGKSAKIGNDWTSVTANNVAELKITDTERDAWIVPGTHTDQGMTKALAQLNKLDSGDELRSRVVVLFTDGELSDYKADDAINTAKQIKDMGCAVYTVATHANASAAVNPELTEHVTIAEEDRDGTVTARYINAVMHSISSNYPEMTAAADNIAPKQVTFSSVTINPAVDRNGNGIADDGEPSYYLVANSTASLNTIFQSIASSIQSGSASMQLGSSTVVKDIVSDYFDPPADASDVTVKTYDCMRYDAQTGAAAWSATGTDLRSAVTIDAVNKAVNVTGFDFSRNFVSENGRDENDAGQAGDFRGRKLVITFDAPVRDGFLGGNGVPTNGSATGVYSGGALVEAFEQPKVDVPVQIPTVSAPDYHVYLLGGKTDAQLKAGTAVTAGGQTVHLDPSATNYGLESWQNAYVSISADPMSGFGSLTADTPYSARVTFTPINSGLYEATSGSDTGSICVYKPVVTYKDSTIVLGDTADYAAQNYVSVVWKHDDTAAASDMGTEPVLIHNYSPAEAPFREDTPVQAAVMIGTTDVTGYTTFYRSACTYDGCSNQTQTTVSAADENRVNFVVHVLRYELTISKKVEGLPEDQIPASFTFLVVDAKNEEHTVTVSSDGAETITVPAGRATVTETTQTVPGYNLSVTVNDVTGDTIDVFSETKAAHAAFVNTYTRHTTSVTIGKTVSGNMGDRSEAFPFTVTMKDTDNSPLSFTHNATAVDSAVFCLKHGETVTLTDVPVGATVTVTETPGSYTASAKVNSDSVTVTNGSLSFPVLDTDADSVVVNNDRSVTVDTGVDLDSLPYVLILVGVSVAGVILAARRRTIEDEYP